MKRLIVGIVMGLIPAMVMGAAPTTESGAKRAAEMGYPYVIPLNGLGGSSGTPYGSITNTCYVSSMTTTITGNGWIDCRGAQSIVVSVNIVAMNDPTITAGNLGCSIYFDASTETANVLPNTNLRPWWNDVLSPAPSVCGTAKTIVVDAPPASLRLRWSGPPIGVGPTVSIGYHLIYGGGGKAVQEQGKTPPLHW
jgi:hypothetical protein